MIDSTLRSFVAGILNCRVDDVRLERVVGGDINQSFRANNRAGEKLFVKANSCVSVLQSEYHALLKLSELGVEYYPQPVGFQADENGAYLALPFLSLQGLTNSSAPMLATALFNQHSVRNTEFGWYEDGYIGHARQCNPWTDCWSTFFIEFRLKPQLASALNRGLSAKTADLVLGVMQDFGSQIESIDIQPSLLHGDLWSGNLAYDSHRAGPALFDPAPYFGDPEADVAMTMLFGQLPQSFYRQYRELTPQPADFQYRCSVYNLYHALNHVSLFGLGYESLVVNLCKSAFEAK